MSAADVAGARELVASVPLWYHTIDLPDGGATPGWFDLRPILHRLPIPDVRGKRCLDVGTYDGFLAFELERRGASEVVATDISDHTDWDWPARARAQGGVRLAEFAGPEKGRGFRVAHKLLGSSVDRQEISVYDLSPERLGAFDVVVCGSLMLHLRDPIRALEAIRSVCSGLLVSAEEIRVGLTARHPRLPVVEMSGSTELCQWWLPNVAGHRRMVEVAGLRIEHATRPYAIPFGVAHPPRRTRSLAGVRRLALGRAIAGGEGVPHAAILARPDV